MIVHDADVEYVDEETGYEQIISYTALTIPGSQNILNGFNVIPFENSDYNKGI